MFVRRRNRRVGELAGQYGRVPQPIVIRLITWSLAVRYAYCHANAHAVGYTITFGFAHRHAFAQAFGNPERHPVADQAPQAAAAPPEAHPG